jgi:hypothetical protein
MRMKKRMGRKMPKFRKKVFRIYKKIKIIFIKNHFEK